MASAWQTVYIEVRALFDFAVFCRIWRSIRQQRDCIPLGKGSEVSRRTAPFIFSGGYEGRTPPNFAILAYHIPIFDPRVRLRLLPHCPIPTLMMRLTLFSQGTADYYKYTDDNNPPLRAFQFLFPSTWNKFLVDIQHSKNYVDDSRERESYIPIRDHVQQFSSFRFGLLFFSIKAINNYMALKVIRIGYRRLSYRQAEWNYTYFLPTSSKV